MFSETGAIKKVDNYVYNTSNILGSGASSTVYLGSEMTTKQVVAIRVVVLRKLSPQLIEILHNQMSVLNYLPPHPNILKILKILQTENNVYFVTEYCDSKLKLNQNSDLYSIAYGIISGLKHLYQNQVVHRDLKPDNIMLKNGVPKIIDFGFALYLKNKEQVITTRLGTPQYMSPQILDHTPYTSKSDIWSLGVTLYELLYQKFPFKADTEKQLSKKQRTTNPQFITQNRLTQIIKRCLVPSQSSRITWDELFVLAETLIRKQSIIKQSSSKVSSDSKNANNQNPSNNQNNNQALKPRNSMNANTPNTPTQPNIPQLHKANSYDYNRAPLADRRNQYYN